MTTIAAHQAHILGLKPATVRQWAKRRRLHPVGLDRCGRPLYAVDHVTALAARQLDQHRQACHA